MSTTDTDDSYDDEYKKLRNEIKLFKKINPLYNYDDYVRKAYYDDRVL